MWFHKTVPILEIEGRLDSPQRIWLWVGRDSYGSCMYYLSVIALAMCAIGLCWDGTIIVNNIDKKER